MRRRRDPFRRQILGTYRPPPQTTGRQPSAGTNTTKEKHVTDSTAEKQLTIYELIVNAGRDLHTNMRAGYTQGYEFTLADQVIAAYLVPAKASDGVIVENCRRQGHDNITCRESEDAFVWCATRDLLHDKLSELISVDCLLDEEKPGSEVTVEEMTRVLFSEIQRQNGEHDALRRLTTAAIVAEEHIEGRTRQIAAESA